MFHVKYKFLNIMEKETTSAQLDEQSLWSDDVILNTQDPFVGYSEEKQYWYVQLGDTRVAINCKHNADLIAKILECDNDNTEF